MKTEQKWYTPDFPIRATCSYRPRLCLGDPRNNNNETTYRESYSPRPREITEKCDGSYFYNTHWNIKSGDPTPESETHEKYKRYPLSARESQAISTQRLQMTNLVLGEPNAPFTQREKDSKYQVQPPKIENNSARLRATHFILGNENSKWESTSKADYQAYKVKPPELAQSDARLGQGTKTMFEQQRVCSTHGSEYSENYQKPKLPPLELQKIGTEQLRATHFKIGDIRQNDYSTTNRNFAVSTGNEVDKDTAKMIKEKLQKCRATQASPTIKNEWESTTHSAIKAHPGFEPPRPHDNNLRASHFDLRNYNGPVSTTMRDAYTAKTAEKVTPVDNSLRSSHINVGSPDINEKETLYNATYKKLAAQEPFDTAAQKAFMTAHHTNSGIGVRPVTGRTTYQDDFVRFGGRHMRDPAGPYERAEIFSRDSRFNRSASVDHETYRAPPKTARPPPIDNALQRSHINMGLGSSDYSTTQQDYFRYKRYRMPEL